MSSAAALSVQSACRARRRRAKFLPAEDEKLRELVVEHGEGNWDLIAQQMAGRNVRQVRERWKHYLSGTGSEREVWSEDEDLILYEKVAELGPKWTKVAKFLPGKTDIQVKARWNKRFSRSAPQSKCILEDGNAAKAHNEAHVVYAQEAITESDFSHFFDVYQRFEAMSQENTFGIGFLENEDDFSPTWQNSI